MGRPRYRLKETDYSAARGYIERARTRGDVSSVAGYSAFKSAQTAEELQAWCDDYLSEDVWKRLLVTLRQSRKRSKDYNKKPLRHIDITSFAYLALTRVAKDMGKGVTLSKAIERLEDCYWAVKDREFEEKSPGPRKRVVRKKSR